MATKIRQHPVIMGIPMGNSVCKITQFADDSTCFLKHRDHLPPLLDVLQDFSECSGLKINKNKFMIILPNNGNLLLRILEGIPVLSKAKILGICFFQDNTESSQFIWNFKPQLQSICDSWSTRNISIKRKVTVVNSLVIRLFQSSAI